MSSMNRRAWLILSKTLVSASMRNSIAQKYFFDLVNLASSVSKLS